MYPDHIGSKSKIYTPFVKVENIQYNHNFAGIFLNFVIGVIRSLIILPTLSHILTSIPLLLERLTHFGTPFSMRQFISLRICIELPVAILIFMDCINLTSIFVAMGDYLDRMRISTFAFQSSLDGQIGLATFRFMLQSVMLVSSRFDAYDTFSTYKKISDGGLSHIGIRGYIVLITSPTIIAIGACIYAHVALSVSFKWLCCLEFEIGHPQLDVFDDVNRKKLTPKRQTRFATLIMILNLCFILYVITAHLSRITMSSKPNSQDIDQRYFQINIIVIIVLANLAGRLVFHIQQHLSSRDVPTSFFWNLQYVAQSITVLAFSEIEFNENHHTSAEFRQVVILAYYLLIMLAINLAYFIIVFPRSSFNSLIYLIKWGTTRGVLYSQIFLAASILMIAGGFISVLGIGQVYFELQIIQSQFLLDLANSFGTVLKVFITITGIIFDVLRIIGIFVMGILCWVLILGLLIVMVVVIFIGFGAGIPVEIATNIAKVLDQIKKIYNFIARFKKPIKTTIKFASKGKNVVAKVSVTSIMSNLAFPAIIQALSIVSCVIPCLLSVLFLYYVVCDRQARLPQVAYIGLAICMLLLAMLSYGYVLIQAYIFTRTMDLILMKIRFLLGQALIQFQIGHVVTIMGIITYMVAAAIAPQRGNTVFEIDDPLSDEVKFEFPGALACLCPLCVSQDPKFWCERICRCCVISEPDQSFQEWLYVVFCPCCTNLGFEDEDKTVCTLILDELCCMTFDDPKARRCIAIERVCGCCQRYEQLLEDAQSGKASYIDFHKSCEIEQESKHLLMSGQSQRDFLTSTVSGERLQMKLLFNKAKTKNFQYDINPSNKHIVSTGTNNDEEEQEEDTGTKSMMPSQQPKEYFDPSGLRLIPAYFIPMILSLFVFVLIWRSIRAPQMDFVSESGMAFHKLTSDASPLSAKADLQNAKNGNKITCPPLDAIVLIIKMLGSALLGFLELLFPGFFLMVRRFLYLIGVLGDMPIIEIFNMLLKFVMCLFAFLPACQTIIASYIASVTPLIDRITIIRINMMVVYGIVLFLILPFFINGILDMIPFLRFYLIIYDAYWTALMAHFIVVFSMVVLFVDDFAPPITPDLPDDYTEQVKKSEQEMFDVFDLEPLIDKAKYKFKEPKKVNFSDIRVKYAKQDSCDENDEIESSSQQPSEVQKPAQDYYVF